MDNFMCQNSKNSDVVMSSRVRLARNLDDTPFPIRMSREIRKNVEKKIFAAIKNSSFAGDFDLIDISKLSIETAYSYVEKQLISPEFLNVKNVGAFLLSKDKNVSIMLCEEDHIRLMSMTAGQDIYEAYNKADEIDDVLIKNLKIAFDENLGFLTALPTNLGTGLKASFDLHLPAIKKKGMIERLSVMVGKLGLILRPLYNGSGAFYRLSNGVTLGINEKTALDNVSAICDQIVKEERSLREYFSSTEDFEDEIFRAYGTITMARKLTIEEFYNMISLVRVGISMGFINKNYSDIGELMFSVGNNTIMSNSGAELTPDMTSKIRAKIVREKLTA